eukprot:12896073-Prorocentrum_lima.AAC.1
MHRLRYPEALRHVKHAPAYFAFAHAWMRYWRLREIDPPACLKSVRPRTLHPASRLARVLTLVSRSEPTVRDVLRCVSK